MSLAIQWYPKPDKEIKFCRDIEDAGSKNVRY